jgi:transcriptional regulator with XRE-family HTH domain
MPRVGNPERRRRHFIKEWRLFRGFKQQQLADLMNTTKTTVSTTENGKSGYTQDSLEAFAEALGTHPGVLLTRPPGASDRYGVVVPLPVNTVALPKHKKRAK